MKRITYLIIIFAYYACEQAKDEKASTLFEEVSSVISGVNFKNEIPESASMNSFVYEYYYNGGGVATGDVNGDGLVDIFFTGNLVSNALYLNTGDLQFTDISKKAGITGKEGWSTGVSMVDINADGRLDIYVCYSGPFQVDSLRTNELYINQGNDASGYPKFEEKAEQLGLASSAFSTQAAYLDYDLDGDLDVFLLNHNPSRISETELVSGRLSKSSFGDQFFENVGGKFVDKTLESEIFSNAISYGLGIGVGDLNNDGWPDVYVSNDYEEMDYIYINQKNKKFKEEVKSATRHISNFSMGNEIADYDNDGHLDVLVLDMVSEDNYGIKTSMPSMNPDLFNKRIIQGFHHQYMYNTLQRNTTYIDDNAVPKFTDAARLAGFTNTGWSWAPLMADFDNDGWKDVFITNGIKRDFRNNDFNNYLNKLMTERPAYLDDPKNMLEVLNRIPQKPLKNYFYKNNADLSFGKATDEWFPSLSQSLSNGAAYADLDNDGDLDLVVNNIDEKASFYLNNSTNNYINIKFKGVDRNLEGIGAKVWVSLNNNVQYFEHYRVRGFQSSVSAGITVGIGNSDEIDSIKIVWPSGKSQIISNISINQSIVLAEKDAIDVSEKKSTNKLFKREIIADIKHFENQFNDYSKQILLPHKLSQFGPGLAVADINGDGLEDLFFGQALGNNSSFYIQNSNGGFIQSQQLSDENSEVVDALFFDFDNDDDLDLYVVSGGNEFEPEDPKYSDRLYLNEQGVFVEKSNLLPEIYESGSVVKSHDFNNDGLLDLFVGTRCIPGDYPSPATSHLLKNTGERFIDVTASHAKKLIDLGLVTDMEWGDVDQDGDKDMIIVGEWMKPTMLLLEDGEFIESNFSLSDSLNGWYQSIKVVDIDLDGDQDFLLGNLGNNYKYQATAKEPFEVYYSDFDSNGTKDIVLGYYNFGELYPVRGRQCSSQQVPQLKDEFSSYHSFGNSSLADIYKLKEKKDVLSYKASNFSSGILMNTNSKFEFVPFSNNAQLSSINDFLINDWNEDGHLDMLISGNLYNSEIETPRNDSNYGLLLLGDGLGKFQTVDANVSGFYLEGEVRKMSPIQINENRYVVSALNDNSLIFHLMK